MTFKQYISLAGLVLLGLVIAIAEPAGIWAVLLSQGVALAVIGAGGKKLSKVAISLVVLVVSGLMAYLKLDGSAPAFPVWAGNLELFLVGLYAWGQAFVAFATPIVGAAMLQYNLILERLLKILGENVGYRLEPR